MKHGITLGRTFAAAACAALLASCGGGGEDTAGIQPATGAPVAPVAQAANELSGVVVDGYVQGAKVFLDLNNNQALDAGESSATSGEGGRFTLGVEPLSAGQLASAMLVAEVPGSAKDADDGGLTLQQAGRRAYTMMAPAASFLRPGGAVSAAAVISPLTTLVAAEVAYNGMTPEEGHDTVREALSLGGKDLMADFVAQRDEQLRRVARTAAIAAGESEHAAGQSEETAAARERIAAAQRDLKQRLPAFVQQGEGRAVSVADVTGRWSAAGSQRLARKFRTAPEGYTRMIVRLDDSVEDPKQIAEALAGAHGGAVRHTYRRAIKGFAVDVPDASVDAFVQALQADARVDIVEEDAIVRGEQTVQSAATWGLDRLDQRALPLSGTYTYQGNGTGVHAYIVDSGLRTSHSEFAGRVKPGYSSIQDGRGTNDCHGHGTHVAGTVGGSTWGLAKGVSIVPVRVLGCDNLGSISGIIAGIDWVTANAVKPAVANVSIGASTSASLDAAIERAVSAGITVAVAAGNNGANACNYSPARTPGAITVGASNVMDSRPTWSNYGSCLDVFAPGQDIMSAGIASDSATYLMWGTSMATPHVAGLAALLLQQNPGWGPASVLNSIKASATSGILASVGTGSPNLLLFSTFASAPAPAPVTTTTTTTTTTTQTTSSATTAPALYMAVASIAGSSKETTRRYWRAMTTVAVRDEYERMVPGVLVRGTYSVGGSNLGCTTGSNGTCVITSGSISRTTASTKFTVGSLAKTGVTYMPSYNNANSVSIASPAP